MLFFPKPRFNTLFHTLRNRLFRIQGNCDSSTPPIFFSDSFRKEAISHRPEQCILIANRNLCEIFNSSVWLHNIHIRTDTPRRSSTAMQQLFLVNGSSVQLWMTNVTFQGVGDGLNHCSDCALTARYNARVYTEGESQLHNMRIKSVIAILSGYHIQFLLCLLPELYWRVPPHACPMITRAMCPNVPTIDPAPSCLLYTSPSPRD